MATNDQVNVEAVQAGLKAVKLLRSSVRDLFKSLADGSLIGQQQDDHQSTEKTFISDVQNSINNISIRIRELESSCTLLAHPVIPVDLGNSGKLGQDPAYERIQLYSSMVSAYRWSDKLHEYASHAYAILNQNSLKRSHPTVQNVTTQMIGGRPARMPVGPLQRRSLTTGHNIQAQQVDNFCSMLQRLFPDMNIEILRPFGNPTHLKITLERVLKAVILLRGLVIEWVIIKGYHEDFVSDDSKFDIWSESRYEVFRKLTEVNTRPNQMSS